MEFNLETFLKLLAGSGGVVALLVLAVKWMLGTMETERNERISLLEKQSLQCSNDRIELHKNLTMLQNEVRTLYKSIIAGKFDKSFFEDDDKPKQHEQRTEVSSGA